MSAGWSSRRLEPFVFPRHSAWSAGQTGFSRFTRGLRGEGPHRVFATFPSHRQCRPRCPSPASRDNRRGLPQTGSSCRCSELACPMPFAPVQAALPDQQTRAEPEAAVVQRMPWPAPAKCRRFFLTGGHFSLAPADTGGDVGPAFAVGVPADRNAPGRGGPDRIQIRKCRRTRHFLPARRGSALARRPPRGGDAPRGFVWVEAGASAGRFLSLSTPCRVAPG
jgi:hypothetical protein